MKASFLEEIGAFGDQTMDGRTEGRLTPPRVQAGWTVRAAPP